LSSAVLENDAMNRRMILSVLGAAAFSMVACSRSSKSDAPLKELTVDDVAARIEKNDGKTFVYDNNPKDRFEKGHLPGAKWVKHDAVTAADLPSDKSATLIFYCANEL
jgi:hypothetical protein